MALFTVYTFIILIGLGIGIESNTIIVQQQVQNGVGLGLPKKQVQAELRSLVPVNTDEETSKFESISESNTIQLQQVGLQPGVQKKQMQAELRSSLPLDINHTDEETIKFKSISPAIIRWDMLWQSHEAAVNLYRAPLITYTPGGNLLAIAEGRKNSGDASPKFIAIRRLVDGSPWQTESFIHDDGFVVDGDNLGVVLVDDVTKHIYIFYVLCAHHVLCSQSSVMYVKSVDDGILWLPPVNITAQAGPKDFAPGPGYGIQKKYSPYKGRLIVCGHGGKLDVDGNFCLLSDDHGTSWYWGATMLPIPAYTSNRAGDFVPDECQPIELSNGDIMLNSRNQYHNHCRCRIVSMSYDGMETIPMSSITFDPVLVDSAVSASIMMHEGIVFFSNPASPTSRVNMTLRWSFDEGATWSGSLSIWSKASGYSCMTGFPERFSFAKRKYIYIIYENGYASSTESIVVAKISLDGSL